MTPVASIQRRLEDFKAGVLPAEVFCRQMRAEAASLALPERYHAALGRVLDSLESSALFDGESCSFSREDLVAALQQWLDAASAALARGGSQPAG